MRYFIKESQEMSASQEPQKLSEGKDTQYLNSLFHWPYKPYQVVYSKE